MARYLLAGVSGGIAMWVVGFLFWGTPLSLLAFSRTDEATTALMQQSLAQHLAPLGTGAYPVPWPGTASGTQLYGQGPISIVFFNTDGFAHPDTSALIAGLVLAILCALVAGFALRMVAGRLDFAGRLKVVTLIAMAVTAYSNLGQPIFNHMPPGYFFYRWIAELASWIAAGAALAWILPRPVLVHRSEE